jgi:hypothetical protein
VGTDPARTRNRLSNLEATVGLPDTALGGVLPKGEVLLLLLLLLLGISMYFGVCTLRRPEGGGRCFKRSSSSSSSRKRLETFSNFEKSVKSVNLESLEGVPDTTLELDAGDTWDSGVGREVFEDLPG